MWLIKLVRILYLCLNNIKQSHINLYNGIKIETLANDSNYINYDEFIDKVNKNNKQYQVLFVLSHLLKKSISSPILDLKLLNTNYNILT